LLVGRRSEERLAPLLEHAQSLVCGLKERPLRVDLGGERGGAAATGEEAETRQFTIGLVERTFGGGTRPRDRNTLLLEQLEGCAPLFGGCRSFDLGPRLVLRADGKRTLVDGEPLERRFLERLREARDRVTVVEFRGVAFTLEDSAGDVERGLL